MVYFDKRKRLMSTYKRKRQSLAFVNFNQFSHPVKSEKIRTISKILHRFAFFAS